MINIILKKLSDINARIWTKVIDTIFCNLIYFCLIIIVGGFKRKKVVTFIYIYSPSFSKDSTKRKQNTQ